jgi:hypothetical protein
MMTVSWIMQMGPVITQVFIRERGRQRVREDGVTEADAGVMPLLALKMQKEA